MINKLKIKCMTSKHLVIFTCEITEKFFIIDEFCKEFEKVKAGSFPNLIMV